MQRFTVIDMQQPLLSKHEDMDKVIEYCDKIIASPQYALSSEYFSIFNDNNHTNRELIFAVDQRADLNGHNRMAYFSLSGDIFLYRHIPVLMEQMDLVSHLNFIVHG